MPHPTAHLSQPDDDAQERLFDHQGGTDAPWYGGWDITPEKREFFRERSRRSHEAKLRAYAGEGQDPLHDINIPALDPGSLMPQCDPVNLSSLSLFSGGGGLDLGFDRAGYTHVASFDTLEPAGETLLANRPLWEVRTGDAGDVRGVDWTAFRGDVDVLHGGPPCQPFSAAGRQRGSDDVRNMLPEFVRAVLGIQPAAFVAENVAALAGPKFADYLDDAFRRPLSRGYEITMFRLAAHDFGVPQVRRRVFFVGVRKGDGSQVIAPTPTHRADHLVEGSAISLDRDAALLTHGARSALGLPDIGHDALAPTLRSTLTGPRHTTSVLSSASAQKTWRRLRIWPNGVSRSREAARKFVPENGHFRLSVADCAVLQGFPPEWSFSGPAYMALGQIGNSVAPPVGYQVARAVAAALGASR